MDHKTEESRMNYNRKAKEYDKTFEGRFTIPYNTFICDNILLTDEDTILDVACGNGRLLRMLSQKAKINAFGIDISEEMIKIASKDNEQINFVVCSADQTPFDDNKFDLIIVCCAFHHFVHPQAFMTEAERILKSGGKLLIAEPTLPIIIRQVENIILPFLKMGDVRTYSKKEMVSFFEKANLKQISFNQNGMKLFIEGIKR